MSTSWSGCSTAEERITRLNAALGDVELFSGAQRDVATGQNSSFLLSPEPLLLPEETVQEIERLGPVFLSFYRAINSLYQQSVRGRVPDFVREYLDMGKSERVIEYARLNRFKTDLPIVLRPDIIPTDDGMAVTELDSVPGGMGVLGFLAQQYARMGYRVVGGANGMLEGFAAALRSLRPDTADPLVAIVVSDESEDYRGEMAWLASALGQVGLRARACHPRELVFAGDGLFLPPGVSEESGNGSGVGYQRIDILYRFFELFDLKNIPQIDLILYAIRKEMVAATPPLKSHLEEKLSFALFHHPGLSRAWRRELSEVECESLRRVLPRTWVMDERSIPPHAVIPGLTMSGVPVTDFMQLATASQKERQMVIKPSGYSPEAWGSRGVTVGHDVSAEEWTERIRAALAAFGETPHILQEFRKGRKLGISYYDFDMRAVRKMHGRARLCPYYMVVGDDVHLAGILATVVPLNKKAIHGMVDAVIAPVAIGPK